MWKRSTTSSFAMTTSSFYRSFFRFASGARGKFYRVIIQLRGAAEPWYFRIRRGCSRHCSRLWPLTALSASWRQRPVLCTLSPE
jgi:hypothetical protein